jgi:hypothetical protein
MRGAEDLDNYSARALHVRRDRAAGRGGIAALECGKDSPVLGD